MQKNFFKDEKYCRFINKTSPDAIKLFAKNLEKYADNTLTVHINKNNSSDKALVFSLMKKSSMQNSFNPVFYGKFIEVEHGWQLSGRLGKSNYTRIFMRLLYSFDVILLMLLLIVFKAGLFSVLCAFDFTCILILVEFLVYKSSVEKKNAIRKFVDTQCDMLCEQLEE